MSGVIERNGVLRLQVETGGTAEEIIQRAVILDRFNTGAKTEVLGKDTDGNVWLQQPRLRVAKVATTLDRVLAGRRAVWVEVTHPQLSLHAQEATYVVQGPDDAFYLVSDLRHGNTGRLQNDELRVFDVLAHPLSPAEMALPRIREAVTEIVTQQQDRIAFARRNPTPAAERLKSVDRLMSDALQELHDLQGKNTLEARQRRAALKRELQQYKEDRAALFIELDQMAAETGTDVDPDASDLPARRPLPEVEDKLKKMLEKDTYQNRWWERVGERTRDFFAGFVSELPELPVFGKSKAGLPTSHFALFREGYRLLRGATESVKEDARQELLRILEPINAKGATEPGSAYNVFRAVIIARDLWFRSRQLAPGFNTDEDGSPRTLQLPGDMTPEQAQASLDNAQKELAAHPDKEAIQEAIRRHYAFVRSEVEALESRGYLIPPEMRNPFYYPHKVLKHWDGKLKNVSVTTSEDFRGYLRPLVGSVEKIEMDYYKAMLAHMVEVMSDNRRMDLVDQYWKGYDEKDNLIAQAARWDKKNGRPAGTTSYRAFIPPGYKEVVIDKRVPLRGEYVLDRNTLAQKLGDAIGENETMKAAMKRLGVTLTAEDVRQALIAEEARTWVVPEVFRT